MTKLPSSRAGMCAASVALAVGLLAMALGIVQGAGSLTRITTASPAGSDPLNSRRSHYPSLSANGTKITFSSDSDFLGQGIITFQEEIWLYDTTTMTLTRVTTGGGFGANLSANGRKIAFQSHNEIWLYDTVTMTRTHITTVSNSDRLSFGPSPNADGTKIAFGSDSDFLGQGIPNDQYEIWFYNSATMQFTRVTTASDSNRDSGSSDRFFSLDMSANGEKIVFASDSDFLNQGIPDDQYEIWLYDTATKGLTRITTASAGNRDSHLPFISADGRKVVFSSDSDFLGQGIADEQTEIWLYDTQTMTLTRITTASDGSRDSFEARVNANGTKIALTSDSDLLDQGNPYHQYELWLYDTTIMTFTRITSNSRSTEWPSLSANGTKIAFASSADYLGQGIPLSQVEIWLYSEATTPTLVSTTESLSSVLANQPLTYTLIVSNNGSADATGVVISDTLDNKVTFASASYGGQHNEGIVTWNVGVITKGQAITRTLAATVGNVPKNTHLNNIFSVAFNEGASSSTTITTIVVGEALYLPTILKQ